MSSVPFEALSANSPFAELRGFVKAHGLSRGGVPLKATSKAALYAQIADAWSQPRAPPGSVDGPDDECIGSREPFAVLVDTLFPDRLDTLRATYPFFNGLDPELILERVNRHIRDHRTSDGTFLYVGTASPHPERGLLVVRNGQAESFQPESLRTGQRGPCHVYDELVAHGAVYDEELTPSREVVVEQRRMHAALVQSGRDPAGRDSTRPASVHRRRQWLHGPVVLAHTGVVLHPPRTHHPRKKWQHRAVTLLNADATLYPKHSPSAPQRYRAPNDPIR